LVVFALFGLFQAGTYPIISKVTRSWFPASYRTSVQGAVTAFGRIGGACAPLILATLLMRVAGLPWYTIVVVIAVPGLALAAAIWIVFRDSPREHPWTNEHEREEIGAGQPAAGPTARLRLTTGSVKTLAALLLYAFASTLADMLYVFWIPLFLSQEKCLDQGMLGLFAPLPLIGGAVGGIVGGMLNDVLIRRTGQRRWVRTGIAFTGKSLAAILILVSLGATDGRLAMVVLLAVKFFGDWSLPTQWGTVTDIGGKSAATLFGLVNSAGAVGGALAGRLMSFALENYGWDGLFIGVACVYMFAALCWLFIDCTQQLSE
jgi:sugar phosphate permease